MLRCSAEGHLPGPTSGQGSDVVMAMAMAMATTVEQGGHRSIVGLKIASPYWQRVITMAGHWRSGMEKTSKLCICEETRACCPQKLDA